MATAQQRLDEVRAAIKVILEKGQRIRKGDRQLDRAELAGLRMLEDQYAAQAAVEAKATRTNLVRYYSKGKGAR